MASETTPLIGLYKAIPGTNEPFRASDLNNNWDILDDFIVGYQDQFDDIAADATTATTAANAATTNANAAAAANTAALVQFEIDSQDAIDALDTNAIVTAIAAEGVVLDINGGTA